MENSITLVVFTFLSQLAIGGFVTLFFLDTYRQKLSEKTRRNSLFSLIAFSIVAVIVSMFHLGHPLSAYYALFNFGQSWLSREIVFFPAFILFLLLFTFFAKTEGARKVTGWIGTIFGAVTIICTAMIYIIPAVPAWDNALTLISFFATAILLGPIFIQLIVSVMDKKLVDLSKFTIVMAVFVIIMNLANLTILNGGLPEAATTASLLIASPLFWVKMIGLLVGLGVAFLALRNKKIYTSAAVALIFVSFAAAEFIGRILFYATGVHL